MMISRQSLRRRGVFLSRRLVGKKLTPRTHSFFFWFIKTPPIKIKTALFILIFLDRNAMVPRIGIVANACHLPRYFHAGFATRYFKTIISYFLRNVEIGSGCADGGKLVTEFLIERAEVVRHRHDRFTFSVQS